MVPASNLKTGSAKSNIVAIPLLKSTSRTFSRCFRLDQKRRNILLPCYSPCGESSSGRGKGAGLCELIINIPPLILANTKEPVRCFGSSLYGGDVGWWLLPFPSLFDKWGVLDTFPTYIYCNPEGMCEVFRTPLFLLTIGVFGHRWGYSHIERTQCRLKMTLV